MYSVFKAPVAAAPASTEAAPAKEEKKKEEPEEESDDDMGFGKYIKFIINLTRIYITEKCGQYKEYSMINIACISYGIYM